MRERTRREKEKCRKGKELERRQQKRKRDGYLMTSYDGLPVEEGTTGSHKDKAGAMGV